MRRDPLPLCTPGPIVRQTLTAKSWPANKLCISHGVCSGQPITAPGRSRRPHQTADTLARMHLLLPAVSPPPAAGSSADPTWPVRTTSDVVSGPTAHEIQQQQASIPVHGAQTRPHPLLLSASRFSRPAWHAIATAASRVSPDPPMHHPQRSTLVRPAWHDAAWHDHTLLAFMIPCPTLQPPNSSLTPTTLPCTSNRSTHRSPFQHPPLLPSRLLSSPALQHPVTSS